MPVTFCSYLTSLHYFQKHICACKTCKLCFVFYVIITSFQKWLKEYFIIPVSRVRDQSLLDLGNVPCLRSQKPSETQCYIHQRMMSMECVILDFEVLHLRWNLAFRITNRLFWYSSCRHLSSMDLCDICCFFFFFVIWRSGSFYLYGMADISYIVEIVIILLCAAYIQRVIDKFTA